MPSSPIGFRVFLGDAPSQINLVHIDQLPAAARAELWEDEPRQHVAFAVHIAKCGRDEHADGPPSWFEVADGQQGRVGSRRRATVGSRRRYGGQRVRFVYLFYVRQQTRLTPLCDKPAKRSEYDINEYRK